MISNFFVAVNAVVPLFCLIFIGTLVRRFKLMTDVELNHMNKMVFTVFFSIMMFYNLYTADLKEGINPGLMLFGGLGVFGLFLLGMIGVHFFEPCKKRKGAIVQAIFRSNFVIMGIPIVVNIFGSEAAAVPTMMIAVIVPLYNVLAVFALETFRGKTFALMPILRGVAKNPMIVGMAVAVVFKLVGIVLPESIVKSLGQVAAATTPIALIILGASFTASGTGLHRPQLWIVVFGRLILSPVIILSLAVLLGYRGVEFVTLLTIFGTPCAVSSYAMAQQMGSDGELAGNCVVITSGLSCITIFCLIFVTKTMGLF